MTMASLFEGMTLMRNQSGELQRLEPEQAFGDVPLIGLYFSASWCGPCRQFTPRLKELYENQEVGLGKMLEIVFVSNDVSESSFMSYLSEEHGEWLTLPYHPEEDRMLMNDKYRITGIPALVVVGKHGNTISTDAKNKLVAVGVDGFRNWLFSKVPLVIELDSLIEKWKKDWLKEKADEIERDWQFRKQLYNCICTHPPDGGGKQAVAMQDKAMQDEAMQRGTSDLRAPDVDVIVSKRSKEKRDGSGGSSRRRSSGVAKDAPPLPPTEDMASPTEKGADRMVQSGLHAPLATPVAVFAASKSDVSTNRNADHDSAGN